MNISLLIFFKIVSLTLCISIYDSSASTNKPNFIVIMTDDQGYNDVDLMVAKIFQHQILIE